jgi:mono/diheme cytochrome c family protein
MARKIIKTIAGFALILGIAIAAFVVYAGWRWDAAADAPLPPLQADRSPAGLARGAAIFHSTCEVCHRAPGSERVSGAPVTDAPAFLGSFHAANITAHPTAGIGSYRDAELARLVRYGVNRHGHRTLMPTYAMGDADVAALLGFLRSDDPLFRADATVPPRSRLSALGKAVLVLSGMAEVPDRPALGIPVPAKQATPEYGRYLAVAVFDCIGCHSPGFGAKQPDAEDAFVGGFEFQDPSGHPVVSRNLTPHETGIAHYSRDDLARALKSGLRPDGSVLSAPMPLFRGLEDVEIDALYAYLRSLPARPAEGGARTPGRRPSSAPKAASPAERFSSLGCAACHGKGAHHEGALARVAEKTPLELARWIRNPELTLPGTPMPSYASVLDEASALELATWVRDGGPKQLAAVGQ